MDPVTLKNEKVDYNKLLNEWNKKALQLKELKAEEMELRLKLSAYFCPNPKEGTNTVDLGNKWKLKNVHKINRKCDKASFNAVFAEMFDGAKDLLIEWKPELILKEYRKLAPEWVKIFDQALIIKPGSPDLKLVSPKVKS